MRFSIALVVGALCVVVYSGTSLFAEPTKEASCCSGAWDCSEGNHCCDAESVGQPPCSTEAPGICMPTCIPTRR